MTRCPGCQSDNPDDSKYCRGCGTALNVSDKLRASQISQCPVCNNVYVKGTKFCEHCGTPVSFQAMPRSKPPYVSSGYSGNKKRIFIASVLIIFVLISAVVIYKNHSNQNSVTLSESNSNPITGFLISLFTDPDDDPAACLQECFDACIAGDEALASEYFSILVDYSGNADGVQQWLQDREAREKDKAAEIKSAIRECSDGSITFKVNPGQVMKKGNVAVVGADVTEFYKNKNKSPKQATLTYLLVKEDGKFKLWKKYPASSAALDEALKIYAASGIK